MSFDLDRCLPGSEHYTEYLLYEVWRDREGLRKPWESDFPKVFQGKLMAENLLAAPPELKFFQYERIA